jgi:CRP-like cAMP-binding protein
LLVSDVLTSRFVEGGVRFSRMREFAYIHEEGAVPKGLKGIPFLAHFDRAHLDDILYSSSIIECDPGDAVIEEGGSGSRIYILTSGEVEISKKGERLAVLNTVGDIFGELAALGDEVRSATVRAVKPTLLLAVDQKFLQDIKPRQENPAFYASFFEFLGRLTAQRLKSTSDSLSRMEARVAALEAELRELRARQFTAV